ncbi:hypothetical protein FKP32DRAFT_1593585 [Trametes sanguinea]|nr:hypothetical protein FKP32DRAFT_1593585 [Trametes sanguinea]
MNGTRLEASPGNVPALPNGGRLPEPQRPPPFLQESRLQTETSHSRRGTYHQQRYEASAWEGYRSWPESRGSYKQWEEEAEHRSNGPLSRYPRSEEGHDYHSTRPPIRSYSDYTPSPRPAHGYYHYPRPYSGYYRGYRGGRGYRGRGRGGYYPGGYSLEPEPLPQSFGYLRTSPSANHHPPSSAPVTPVAATPSGNEPEARPHNRAHEATTDSMDINHYMHTGPSTPSTGEDWASRRDREEDGAKWDDTVQRAPHEVYTTTAGHRAVSQTRSNVSDAGNGDPLPVTDAPSYTSAPQTDMPALTAPQPSALGRAEGHDPCPTPAGSLHPPSPNGGKSENSTASTMSLTHRDGSRTPDGDHSSLTTPEPIPRFYQPIGDVQHVEVGDRRREVRLRLLEARVEELVAKLDVVRLDLEMLRMGEK